MIQRGRVGSGSGPRAPGTARRSGVDYRASMISTMTTITATAPTNHSRNPNAAASERIGLGGPFMS